LKKFDVAETKGIAVITETHRWTYPEEGKKNENKE
jgi:hypothetical protein